MPLTEKQVFTHQRRVRKFWRWAIPAALFAVALPVAVVQIAIARAGPILKGRVVDTLRARFGSDVQLDGLHVTVMHGVRVSGTGLRIFPIPEVMATGYHTPVISIGEFEFSATVSGLIFRPTRVGTVYVRGLAIHMPPADLRGKAYSRKHHLGKVKVRVEEIVCDDSQLVIETDKPDKDPRVFRLKHVVLRDLGPGTVWPYDAILTNPIPRGEIHATGTFGPWNTEDPGNSNVSGRYTFEHADLNTIKGLGGMLNSNGIFDGQLDKIAVHGKTEVPNFSLDTANHAMPLSTEFRATVDGTTGDTYLEKIDAKLGESQFTCSGAVINIKGKGHSTHIDVDVPDGALSDFLRLAVKSIPPPMTGSIALTSTLDIDPGDESVTKKLKLKGEFSLRQIHFTNPEVEDKIDVLSLRARGETDNLKPGAPDVFSQMVGDFSMERGGLTFHHLEYSLPGGDLELAGTYRLEGRVCDFNGKVRTKAEISEMVKAKWKSWLLKPLDPFFHKHGWGAEIPVHISGRNGKIHFGYKF